MTAIASPKPRLASRRRAHSPAPLLSPPLYLPTDHRRMAPAGLASPPRLLSPIHLTESTTCHSKPSCSSKKRRTQSGVPRTARRRHLSRFDRATSFAAGASIFDQLPWISLLNQEPERTSVWDIADLSLLPAEPVHQQPSGVGPVRSRKFCPRADPLSYSSPVSQDFSFDRTEHRPSPTFPLFDRELADPRTPPPRDASFRPEDVQFFGLMPALPINDEPSRSC